ncbi:DMT family transporter [Humibacter sp. RRB41]|uniref:DMT family transporter n=1 Tax=Humibacter sp. RRB41 TaxID=2919946 RepID=UPI001FAAA4E9|nr:DMT family transporter [Humibacter sp. RRB41]
MQTSSDSDTRTVSGTERATRAGTRSRSREVLADALLVAVAAAWGSSFLAAKDLTDVVGVLSALALRFLFAAVAAVVLVLVRRERMPRGRGLIIAIALGGFQATIIGLETWGVHLTTATNAGLISSLALIGTPLLESIASRAWLPPAFFVAAVVAVVGVALLVSGDGFHAPNLGDIVLLIAAVVRSIRVVTGGHLLRHRRESSLSVVCVQVLVSAVVFSALAAPELPGAFIRMTASSWFDVVFLGLICSVFAFAIELWAVRRTSAARASILMGTEPVWAVITGAVVGGEALTIVGAVGGLLIVASSYAGGAIERRHRLRGASTA